MMSETGCAEPIIASGGVIWTKKDRDDGLGYGMTSPDSGECRVDTYDDDEADFKGKWYWYADFPEILGDFKPAVLSMRAGGITNDIDHAMAAAMNASAYFRQDILAAARIIQAQDQERS